MRKIMKKKDKKICVAVGMSGGVDSSVAALLLKQQGYDVIGFFMKLWHDPCGTGENACCNERAQADARAVAAKLGIPFYVVDARASFIQEYESAKTPNPCLVCNKKIKFGWLLDFAKKNHCDFLATGHYAKVISENGIQHLQKPLDSQKDQTYFLSGLNQDQLKYIMFPLSDLTKDTVRQIAKENDLPVYQKKESQEVCFVEGDYRDFLKRNASSHCFNKGDIVDLSGKLVGHHNGLVNYTIGQRKGINQSGKSGAARDILYVTGFDKEKNRLIVGDDKRLEENRMIVQDLNLIDQSQDITHITNLSVKIRYGAKEVPCEAEKTGEEFKITLAISQRAVTPGQFAVFYHGGEVIGNGKIK